jgi:DNA-directed RNA polymerase specialized sigma24 family protein
VTIRAIPPPQQQELFWKTLRARLRSAARSACNAARNIGFVSDAEDLAQEAVIEALEFFRSRTTTGGISAAELINLQDEVTRFAHGVLKNKFLTEVRTIRRRRAILASVITPPPGADGAPGFRGSRADQPDEVLIGKETLAQIRKHSSLSKRYEKLADAAEMILENGAEAPTSKDLTATAGVSSKDLGDFRTMLRNKGITPLTRRDNP